MLVLTRRVGESIIIGHGKDKIVITVLASRGEQSKIGIKAHDKISVHREEVYQRIQNELNLPQE